MTQKISILTLAYTATVALEAERFITAAGAYPAAAGNAVGVTTTKAAIGELVATDIVGTAVVVAGGAIAKNAFIDVGANGKAVTHAAGKVVAQALQAAAADGDRIEVLLIQNAP